MEKCFKACYNLEKRALSLENSAFYTKTHRIDDEKENYHYLFNTCIYTRALRDAFACDRKGDDGKINYAIDNSFIVLERNIGNALVFSPVTNATRDENGKVTNGNNLNCEYGVILYVGMGVEPENILILPPHLQNRAISL